MVSLVIDLKELAEASNAEVSAMEAELTGNGAKAAAKDQSHWPLRFIAAGEKSKGKCDV